MTQDADCVFCRILAGVEPVDMLYEDEDVAVFLPLAFAAQGQTLVIPKVCIPDFMALDVELGGKLMAVCANLGQRLRRALGAEGMNLITSSGRAATQSVFHLHFHLVPRWRGDGFPLWGYSAPLPQEERGHLRELLRSAFDETYERGETSCSGSS